MNGSDASQRLETLLVTGHIFHERQRLQLCAVHALNNLFMNEMDPPPSEPLFTKASLNAIAVRRHEEAKAHAEDLGAAGVGFFNPHRSLLGLGNFDVVVVETACTEHGTFAWTWFNRDKGVDAVPSLDSLVGIMVNRQNSYFWGAWRQNHWYTMRKCKGYYLNLDSNLDTPVVFSDDCEVKKHLKRELDNGGHIFLIARDQTPEPG